MWISKKVLEQINKKIADLEGQVQSQQEILKKHVDDHIQENQELIKVVSQIKDDIYKGLQQML